MRTAVGAVVAIAVLAGAVPARAADRGAPSCARKASATLVVNRVARVYTYRGDLWACVRRTGRRLRLARTREDDYSSASWRGVRLAGRFVAWTRETYDISCKAACPPEYSPSRARVVAYDLRGRRRAVSVDWAGAFHLTTGGGIAWLEEAGEGEDVLRGRAPGQEPVVLDTGAIDPTGVRAYHRLVLWEKDGRRHWAPLP